MTHVQDHLPGQDPSDQSETESETPSEALAGAPATPSRYELELQVRHRLSPLVKTALDHFGSIEHLLPFDPVGLTVFAIGREAQDLLWPRGKAVTAVMVREVCCVAVRTYLEGVDAPEPRWAYTIPVGNRIERWHHEIHYALIRSIAKRGTPRDNALTRAMSEIFTSCGPRRDFEKMRGTVRQVALDLDLVHEEEEIPEPLVRQLLSLVRQQTFGEPGGIMRDANGDIVLGIRQARDELFFAFNVSRYKKRKKHPQRNPSGPADQLLERPLDEDEPETEILCVETTEDLATIQAVEAAAAIELLSRQRAWVAAEAPRCKPGSVAADVLPFLLDYVEGHLSAAEIARTAKRAEGAVHTKLKVHALSMARGCGMDLSEF